jgi:hypothetical protein
MMFSLSSPKQLYKIREMFLSISELMMCPSMPGAGDKDVLS